MCPLDMCRPKRWVWTSPELGCLEQNNRENAHIRSGSKTWVREMGIAESRNILGQIGLQSVRPKSNQSNIREETGRAPGWRHPEQCSGCQNPCHLQLHVPSDRCQGGSSSSSAPRPRRVWRSSPALEAVRTHLFYLEMQKRKKGENSGHCSIIDKPRQVIY